MIEFLRIRDFALVDELSLELSGGFTVLTGETGAGKSILLQALGLLLGERASRETVRTGAEQARVEGLFCPAGAARDAVATALDEAGIPWAADEPVTVARTVGSDGRSRAHVNGALAPLGLLERVGAHLVEISSQHQHQGLLREETHLSLLDAALDPEGHRALEACEGAYRLWSEARAEVERLRKLETESRDRLEYLRYQAAEIRTADLSAGEEDQLRAERDLLAHAGKLLEVYGQALGEIHDGADSALDRLGRAARAAETASRRDPEATAILDLLQEARAPLEEAALRLRSRREALEADPRRLEAVEDRLEAIRRLEKKHGSGTAAILERLASMEREIWELENRELALEGAQKRLAEAASALSEQAAELSRARQATAAALERKIGAELEALALGRAAFRIEISPCDPGPEGKDSVRFLLAPNAGESPRPLAKIASGGELSRVLLALKNALRDSAVETLIFDEVDAGIGGAVADAVGDRLADLARECQVVCITHLPQIASRASRHLLVEKVATADRTVTRVRPLGPRERVDELARMLGGRHVTATTREHARELMERFAP